MGLRLRLEEKTMTKIDVVSGFLGAGKTTLIKKLLKEALDGSKTVLIENEFGEIGLLPPGRYFPCRSCGHRSLV